MNYYLQLLFLTLRREFYLVEMIVLMLHQTLSGYGFTNVKEFMVIN